MSMILRPEHSLQKQASTGVSASSYFWSAASPVYFVLATVLIHRIDLVAKSMAHNLSLGFTLIGVMYLLAHGIEDGLMIATKHHHDKYMVRHQSDLNLEQYTKSRQAFLFMLILILTLVAGGGLAILSALLAP